MKGTPYLDYQSCVNDLGNTLFIKPARSGSSVGVSKVVAEDQLISALDLASKEDSKVIIEGAINGREIEVAVFCPTNGAPIIAEKIGEIKPPQDSFYSYDEKYSTESQTGLVIDTTLSPTEYESLMKSVHKVISSVSLVGTSRIDFFLTPEGEFVLNEINSIPGNTSISMYPKLFETSGTLPTELIRLILKNAI